MKNKYHYKIVKELGYKTYIISEVSAWGETVATYTAYFNTTKRRYMLYPRQVRAPYDGVGLKKSITSTDISSWC